MIKIIAARAGYGKTTRIFEELRQNDEKNIMSYLMVPEQFTLQSEIAVMDFMDKEALMNIKVMSFERLAKQVLTLAGGLKKPYIDEVGKHMALRAVFDQFKDQISMYKTSFKKEGFLSELSHTISELKKMSVQPEDMIKASLLFKDNALLSQKLYEIGFIYQKLSEYMDGKYADNEDRISLMADKIRDAAMLSDIKFYFDSFTGFTSLEFQAISGLAAIDSDMTFSLMLDLADHGDTQIFSPTRATLFQLEKIAKSASRLFEIEGLEMIDCKSDGIRWMEQNLYNFSYSKNKHKVEEVYSENIRNETNKSDDTIISLATDLNKSSVSIFQAMSTDSEIERCAFNILSLVRDEGYRFKDILAVTSMPQIYTKKVSRIFSLYNIPHFVDVKRDIMSSPVINMIFSFIDMFIRNLRYEDVFSFLKTDFADVAPSSYMALENFALKWGLTGQMWENDNRFELDKYFETGEDKEAIASARAVLMNFYKNYRKKLLKKSAASEFAVVLYEFLTEIKAQQKIDEFVKMLKEHNELDYANENAQIWNVLLDTLDQLVEIIADQRMDLLEFRSILYEGLSRHEVGIIPPAIDQVIVATLDRSRTSDIKALFFLGMNDTYVPHIAKDSPILADDDKAALKDAGIDLPSALDNRMLDDDLGIYSALSKPSKRLFISYSLSDDEGKALRPSAIIHRIKKILPEVNESSELFLTEAKEYIATAQSTFSHMSAKLRDYADTKDISEDWTTLYCWYNQNKDWKEKNASLLESIFYQNQQEYIDPSLARKLYDLPLKASVTRLEKFARCPFDHFIDYGLRPKERKIHKIGPPELGTIFHSSIESFGAYANKQENLTDLLDKDECNKAIDSAVDVSISEHVQILMESSKRNAYMINKIKKIARRAAWTMISQMNKGSFETMDLEMDLPAIVLQLEGGDEIVLYGKIDRVDILTHDEKTYVKIIDYKSGSKSFSLSDAYYGIDIQLIVYLEAVLRLMPSLKKTPAYPAGAFYFPITDKQISSSSNDSVYIEQLIDKQLRMDGVVLKDINVIKAMDKDIEDYSAVMNVDVKGDEIKGENALTIEEFSALISHVMKSVKEMAKEILDGNISIKPYLKKNASACSYCRHAGMCKFDLLFDDNEYNRLSEKKDADIKEMLRSEYKNEDIMQKEINEKTDTSKQISKRSLKKESDENGVD